MKPWIIAHRGASGYYPENTLLSFLEAVKMGADCVEMDVQPSLDRELVIFHDRTLERIAHAPYSITKLRLKELQKYDVGRWKGPQWKGLTIPTLKEVLEKLPPTVKLNIELKYIDDDSDWFEQKVLTLALKHDILKRGGYLAIKYPKSIQRLRELLPECPIGLLQKKRTPEELLELCQKFDVDIVQIRRSALTKEWIDTFHDHNIKVNFFYTDDIKEMIFLMKELKIDGILTNYPDRGIQARNQAIIT